VIIVSDTSCLLNLAIIGRLELLRELYGTMMIPTAVYHELVRKGAGMPGAAAIETAEWIVVKEPRNRALVKTLQMQIHPGEAEAIALALDLMADLLLLDERKARVVAAQLGLNFTGLLGLLAEAKQKGHIPTVKPVLDALITQARFWVHPALYNHVLETVGE
jgi:uncharacterized protein